MDWLSKHPSHNTLGWNGYESSRLSNFADRQVKWYKQDLETNQQKDYRNLSLRT